MKKMLLFSVVFTIIMAGCSANHDKTVIATLTMLDGKDVVLTPVRLHDSITFDFKLCLESFGYPPKIPGNIYWIKPDTVKLGDYDKNELILKYGFDDNDRLASYFYQGSMISGIFPLLYYFKYEDNKPYRVSEVEDPYYKEIYRIKYDAMENVEYIEKLDLTGKRMEIFELEIK